MSFSSAFTISPIAFIQAIDPGEHIGFCSLVVYSKWADLPNERVMYSHTALRGFAVECVSLGTVTPSTPELVVQECDTILGRARADRDRLSPSCPLFLIVEHFTFGKKSTYGGSRAVVEMFGLLKALVYAQYGMCQLDTRQTPADALQLISNDLLRDLRIYKRGDRQLDHALMAARHAILAAIRIRERELSKNYNEMVIPFRTD